MIVTAATRAPLRWHFVVFAVAFAVALSLWPAPATDAAAPRAPGLARLQTGTGADTWIEPRIVGGAMHGFALRDVAPGSAWSNAGLENGDVVVAVNDADVADLGVVLGAFVGADRAVVRFERDGVTHTASLQLR